MHCIAAPIGAVATLHVVALCERGDTATCAARQRCPICLTSAAHPFAVCMGCRAHSGPALRAPRPRPAFAFGTGAHHLRPARLRLGALRSHVRTCMRALGRMHAQRHGNPPRRPHRRLCQWCKPVGYGARAGAHPWGGRSPRRGAWLGARRWRLPPRAALLQVVCRCSVRAHVALSTCHVVFPPYALCRTAVVLGVVYVGAAFGWVATLFAVAASCRCGRRQPRPERSPPGSDRGRQTATGRRRQSTQVASTHWRAAACQLACMRRAIGIC